MERYKLTVAAKMLGITPWTLRLWIRQGKVPGIKSASGRLYLPGWWVAEQVGEHMKPAGICPTCGRPLETPE